MEIPSISEIMVKLSSTDGLQQQLHTMVKNKILYILDVLHSFM